MPRGGLVEVNYYLVCIMTVSVHLPGQSKRKSSSQSKRKIKKEETDYKEMFSEDSEIGEFSKYGQYGI